MGLTQLDFRGKTLLDITIERYQEYEPPEGYWLAFSGGKDSIVIHDLAIKAGVKFEAHYAVSPIDPPELHKFMREHYPDVIWDYHAKGFFNIIPKKGLPSFVSRWCCELIKHKVGEGKHNLLGIRWEESGNRKKTYHAFCQADTKVKNTWRVCPILDWTEYDVWDYIESNNLPYPSLYDEGFSRVGCIMCPLAGQPRMRFEAKRYPKMARAWYKAVERYFEAATLRGNLKLNSPEEIWEWWIGMPPPKGETNTLTKPTISDNVKE